MFQEMKLSSPKIKKALRFSQKSFPYISGKETFLLKKLLMFKEITFRARKIKKTHSEKNVLYFSINVLNFLYFRREL